MQNLHALSSQEAARRQHWSCSAYPSPLSTRKKFLHWRSAFGVPDLLPTTLSVIASFFFLNDTDARIILFTS